MRTFNTIPEYIARCVSKNQSKKVTWNVYISSWIWSDVSCREKKRVRNQLREKWLDTYSSQVLVGPSMGGYVQGDISSK
jgi:hypothetical protein